MPLLAAQQRLGLLGLVLGSGCFQEPPPETSGETDPATETNSTSNLVTGTDPQPPGDESSGCMDGCLDPSTNGCLFGRSDDACGASGEECIDCGNARYCDEGTCQAVPLCTAENCAGCCDGDLCVSGLDQGACGRAGQQCTTCDDESTCVDGGCRLPCEDNCAGCCDASGDCIQPDDLDNAACGVEGATCVSCAEDFSCSAGVCISTACATTCEGCCEGSDCIDGTDLEECGVDGAACEACPPGTECASGCRAAPGALWDVIIISAELPPQLPSGASWDSFGGAPDPFVELEVGGMSGVTSVQDNTYFPTWDEVVVSGLTTEDLLDGVSMYTIRDADVVGSELAGSCGFTLTDDLFGSTLTAECTDDEGTTLWTLVLAVLATA